MSNTGTTNRKTALIILVTWMLSLLTILPIAYFLFSSPTSPYAKITSENIDTGAVTSDKISNGSISARKLDDNALPVFYKGTDLAHIDRTTNVDDYGWANMSIWNITISRDSKLLIWLTTRFWINGTGLSLYLLANNDYMIGSPAIDISPPPDPDSSWRYTGIQTFDFQSNSLYLTPGNDLQTVTIRTIWRIPSTTTVAEGYAHYTILVLPA